MNPVRLTSLSLVTLVLLWLTPACSQKTVPPRILTVPELVSGLEKTFTGAKPELRDMEADIVSALKAPDYSRAYLGLQKLAAQANLSRAQGNLLASGLLSVNELLQTAQSQGDTNATQVLQFYHATK